MCPLWYLQQAAAAVFAAAICAAILLLDSISAQEVKTVQVLPTGSDEAGCGTTGTQACRSIMFPLSTLSVSDAVHFQLGPHLYDYPLGNSSCIWPPDTFLPPISLSCAYTVYFAGNESAKRRVEIHGDSADTTVVDCGVSPASSFDASTAGDSWRPLIQAHQVEFTMQDVTVRRCGFRIGAQHTVLPSFLPGTLGYSLGGGFTFHYSSVVLQRVILDSVIYDVSGTIFFDSWKAYLSLGGGAIAMRNGVLNTNQLVVKNCFSPSKGGGLSLIGMQSFRIQNSTFENNRVVNPASEESDPVESTAAVGGAIYMENNHDVTDLSLWNCHFRGNSAVEGGAVGINNGHVAILGGCVFSDNVANGTHDPYHPAHGGAVYANTPQSLRIANATFSGNQVVPYDECTSSLNCQMGAGGALVSIWPAGAHGLETFALNLSDSTFLNNRVFPGAGTGNHGAYGGAIYGSNGGVLVRNVLFFKNSAMNRKSPGASRPLVALDSAGHGGALYYNYITPAPDLPVVIDGCHFVENAAFAGGIAPSSGGAFATSGALSVDIKRTRFDSNTAHGFSTIGFVGFSPGRGGALAISGRAVVNVSDSTFRSNMASGAAPRPGAPGRGGAIYVTGVSKTQLKHVHMLKNKVKSGGDGGALFVELSSTVEAKSSFFDQNYLELTNGASSRGGGIAVLSAGTLTLEDTLLQSNRIVDAGDKVSTANGIGGALYLEDSAAQIRRSKFLNNTCRAGLYLGGAGGAMSIHFGHNTLVQESIFVGNRVIEYTDVGQSPGSRGGAVSIYFSSPRFEDTAFANNSVAGGARGRGYGAGVEIQYRDVVNAQSPVLLRCLFEGNVGVRSSAAIPYCVVGGALSISDSDPLISDCNFKNNSVSCLKTSGPEREGRGGAMYIRSGSFVNVSGSQFFNHRADSGTTIYTSQRNGIRVVLGNINVSQDESPGHALYDLAFFGGSILCENLRSIGSNETVIGVGAHEDILIRGIQPPSVNITGSPLNDTSITMNHVGSLVVDTIGPDRINVLTLTGRESWTSAVGSGLILSQLSTSKLMPNIPSKADACRGELGLSDSALKQDVEEKSALHVQKLTFTSGGRLSCIVQPGSSSLPVVLVDNMELVMAQSSGQNQSSADVVGCTVTLRSLFGVQKGSVTLRLAENSRIFNLKSSQILIQQFSLSIVEGSLINMGLLSVVGKGAGLRIDGGNYTQLLSGRVQTHLTHKRVVITATRVHVSSSQVIYISDDKSRSFLPTDSWQLFSVLKGRSCSDPPPHVRVIPGPGSSQTPAHVGLEIQVTALPGNISATPLWIDCSSKNLNPGDVATIKQPSYIPLALRRKMIQCVMCLRGNDTCAYDAASDGCDLLSLVPADRRSTDCCMRFCKQGTCGGPDKNECECHFPYQGGGCTDLQPVVWVLVAIGILLTGTLVALLLRHIRRRLKSTAEMEVRSAIYDRLLGDPARESVDIESNEDDGAIQLIRRQLVFNQAFVDIKEISFDRKVGEGGFGVVYHAILRDDDVAVKTLKALPFMQITEAEIEKFKEEAYLMTQLRHPNVILTVGVCITTEQEMRQQISSQEMQQQISSEELESAFGAADSHRPTFCAITEWCDRGSLWDVLRDSSIAGDATTKALEPLTSDQTQEAEAKELTMTEALHSHPLQNFARIIDVALGIAKGVRYLHSLRPPVVHRDLKSANVLLTTSWIPKVTDFGTSKFYYDTIGINSSSGWSNSAGAGTEITGMTGTLAWSPPEVVSGSMAPGQGLKVDSYSMGIMLWELVCPGRMPFDEFAQTSRWDVVKAITSGKRPHLPAWVPKQYSQLVQQCWQADPTQRPEFKAIVSALLHIRKQFA